MRLFEPACFAKGEVALRCGERVGSLLRGEEGVHVNEDWGDIGRRSSRCSSSEQLAPFKDNFRSL